MRVERELDHAVDQRVALFLRRDLAAGFLVVGAAREQIDRFEIVRPVGIVEQLVPLLFAQRDAAQVAERPLLAPGGKPAVLEFEFADPRLEFRAALGEHVGDAVVMAHDQIEDPLGFDVVLEHRRVGRFSGFDGPDPRNPFGRRDKVRARQHGGEIAVEHLETHSVALDRAFVEEARQRFDVLFVERLRKGLWQSHASDPVRWGRRRRPRGAGCT